MGKHKPSLFVKVLDGVFKDANGRWWKPKRSGWTAATPYESAVLTAREKLGSK